MRIFSEIDILNVGKNLEKPIGRYFNKGKQHWSFRNFLELKKSQKITFKSIK